MAAHQLSAVTATRGVALKAPRVAVKKARVGTRVQAVRPREPENLVFIPHGWIIRHMSRAVPTPES